MRVVPTTALAGLLLFAGCPTAAAERGPVAVPEVPPDPARTLFTDNPAIVDPHLTRIESFSRHENGLLVNFTAGTPDCFGVHLVTHETADAVTIDLRGGTPPESVGRMCIALVLPGSAEVALRAPLGSRQVLAPQ
ncbi:hypothetical protein BA059_12085 [Mycolicibacterium sp. (ex Dasyatis americana)]|uniref:hypothetical protein n=1 Tax=Mycobacterium TaxID=1763 RepID=UPI000871D027|nr:MULTISPECIES: hypothetical protein [Mycobacterium]MCG7610173.1 hypothetical protein [Mycobacterium sp. CnD-18-1]OFB39656.1 hypothetical protein BA059_12085 [Mycolicibacterium sp. (ex Dasyatis americana)]OLT85538.1 hypothetical protein BKG60_29385 [Mycobacterium syngnathidarum]